MIQRKTQKEIRTIRMHDPSRVTTMIDAEGRGEEKTAGEMMTEEETETIEEERRAGEMTTEEEEIERRGEEMTAGEMKTEEGRTTTFPSRVSL